jgi:AraC-like DNA-binding protein
MSRLPAPRWSIRSYGSSPGSHAHEHFQVLWGLSGNLALEIDGKGTSLTTGNGIVIAPNERHDFESLSGSRCLVLDTPDTGWSARARLPQFAEATDLLVRFITEAIEGQIPIDPHYGAQLLAQSWSGLPSVQRLRRVIDWMGLTQWVKDRLARPLTAPVLAAQVCLSESQFRARCIEAQGCSPMHWVRRLRLEEARILRSTGLGIAEVAKRTGYDSPSALTAALRRERST